LIAQLGCAVQQTSGTTIPVTVSGQNREILLTRVLNRVIGLSWDHSFTGQVITPSKVASGG
jgi:hypothetical protein